MKACLLTRRGALARAAGATALAGMPGAAGGRAAADPHPDAEVLRLCATFEALERESLHLLDTVIDDDQRESLGEPIDEAQSAIMPALLAARATTLDGFTARARVIVLYAPSLLWKLQQPNEGYVDQLMVAALLRDMAGQVMRQHLRPSDKGALPEILA